MYFYVKRNVKSLNFMYKFGVFNEDCYIMLRFEIFIYKTTFFAYFSNMRCSSNANILLIGARPRIAYYNDQSKQKITQLTVHISYFNAWNIRQICNFGILRNCSKTYIMRIFLFFTSALNLRNLL